MYRVVTNLNEYKDKVKHTMSLPSLNLFFFLIDV